jgi:hypothetical protein
MGYMQEKYFKDINKILYSKEYAALKDKQHGIGIVSEIGFLRSKEQLAKKIFEGVGGKEGDNSKILKLFLYAENLAAAPFGQGGTEVLEKEYGYNKRKATIEIINKIGLSPDVISRLNYNSGMDIHTIQGQIVYTINDLTDKMQVLTPEIMDEITEDVLAQYAARDYIACSNKIYEKLVGSRTLSNEEANKVEEQKTMAMQAISNGRQRGIKEAEMLPYLLTKSEDDLMKEKPARLGWMI